MGGNIVDGKLYADNNNLLVFRNQQNQFYWVNNVTQNTNPIKFDYVSKLVGQQISDYLVIPKNVSGSKTLELIITDPVEGFYLVRENKNNTIYMTDLS
mmetsp:Transcript_27223/g.26270  ORF Transcript_27223/g.26270 Transcript_27223/m.26270 type:complete len:98 (-) Transcript_27223:2091-2384(-)